MNESAAHLVPGRVVASVRRSYARVADGRQQDHIWWRGTVLARNDIRAWRGRAAFQFREDLSQAEVDAYVDQQDWSATERVPVLWDSGGHAWADWDLARSLMPWGERSTEHPH